MKVGTIILLGVFIGLPVSAAANDTDADNLAQAQQRLQEAAQELARMRLKVHGEEMEQVFKTLKPAGNRAMLGINIGRIEIHQGDETTVRGDAQEGIEVLGVTPGGPAQQAGIVAGDVIIAINGHDLTNQGESADAILAEVMRETEPGQVVNLSYLRDGQAASVAVVTRPMGAHGFSFATDTNKKMQLVLHDEQNPDGYFHHLVDDLAPHGHSVWRGLELVNLTAALGRYFGTADGLLVVAAPRNKDLGLQEGDVVQAIAGATPGGVVEAMRLLRFYRPGNKLVMQIMRDKQSKTLEVVIPEPSG